MTAHSISLSNLNANTEYHFAVTSANYGTSTISGDDSFSTAAVMSGGGGGGSGGSVGIPSAYGSPSVLGTGITASPSPASSTISTISSSASALQTELNALLAELARLQAEAGESSSASAAPFIFTRNLYFAITGNDVKELQTFLISQNTGPAARKLAAHGTTKTFAMLTQNALIEFQRNAGIHPAIGYFGPITRRYINNLLQ